MKIPLPSRLLTPRHTGKLGLVAAAALALPLLAPAPAASAGDVQWSVTVGSGGYSGGHYKKVWHPPVYRTRYDDCGRAYRVCVRQGYYKQVYVRGSYHAPRVRHYDRGYSRSHYRDRGWHRSSYSDWNRRGQWGNRGSCRY